MSYDKGDTTKYWVIMENGVAKKVTLEQYTASFGVIPTETDNTRTGRHEGSTFGGAYSHNAFADTDTAGGAQNNTEVWTSDQFLSSAMF